MTKRELEQLRHLPGEIQLLDQQIERAEQLAPERPDKVSGSNPEFPYEMRHYNVVGVDTEKADRLRAMRKKKMDGLQAELERMEIWLENVEDSEMRKILKLRYQEGKSWQQVAFAIGEHDEQIPRKKVDRFLKMYEMYEK